MIFADGQNRLTFAENTRHLLLSVVTETMAYIQHSHNCFWVSTLTSKLSSITARFISNKRGNNSEHKKTTSGQGRLNNCNNLKILVARAGFAQDPTISIWV